MQVTAFFNRPKRPIDISQLLMDILNAKQKVFLASAWFTDTEIADALIASKAPMKGVIVNQGDVKRGATSAYKKVSNYFTNNYTIPHANKVAFPDDETRYSIDCIWYGLNELGSGDWQEGVMHHKFVVIDDSIVWTGSYNFTFHARNNYENLVRIESQEITEVYWQEVNALVDEWMLWCGATQFARANGCFRCINCEKLYPESEIGQDGDTWVLCKLCKSQDR